MAAWDRDGDGYVTRLEGGILTLAFDRPEVRNPITRSMTTRLRDLFAGARADPAVRCLVIRGEGESFSAGGDVAGFRKSLEQQQPAVREEFRGRLGLAAELALVLQAFDKPMVVRLRGAVAGAAVMFPLSADLVLADDTAQFVFAYVRLGLTPDAGVSWLLPRVVGERRARRLLLTGAAVGADEAAALGLVDRILPPDQLDDAVDEAARRLAAGPQGALLRTKRLVAQASHRELADQLAAETDGIVESVGSDDFREGVAAFLEKRRARFPSGS
ncbi:2-(1,2-epoxy-1,2-dihydrophenyl)acetyl-CoA isomerase [Tistlia consotensis]|uniref:2-(1,2-epoxy-1,2-dihydrophenyl)acetyl-CoA isomerase n=1 Tax=Tistlia consotensis USBA 355 TaxID=560819 RepID=A0A1Y6CJD9_9PROT|nr:enoyl-CoA hydratase-related protein [Tistlia consotensis]SMF66014.1 2-(1,2-epoxy-1,2-dihydrophenyl)acetyl-CoA isomerase [Tistlia consotensis USBA 355]SNS02815.1 2-(1,2-epoxy-1,2-dihydrophenyl)acetyl-CoA isomerase [Tistlia consotensis]